MGLAVPASGWLVQLRPCPLGGASGAFRFCDHIGAMHAGCSEPRLDLYLIRSASSPVKSETVEPTPCEDCVARTWVEHDGTEIDLQVERDPYLSIPATQLSDAEIVHAKWIYRPYCDSFSLSFRLRISLAEMTDVADKVGDLPTLAIVRGRPVDAGRHIIRGETVTLAFGAEQQAVDMARVLGSSPDLREADDSWRAEVRQRDLATLEELFGSPDKLRRLAQEHGLQADAFKNVDDLASQLFCP